MAIGVLSALVFVESAQACSCAPLRADVALRQSDAAVVASLVKVAPRNRLWADYRYRVRRVYRSAGRIEAGDTISVRSGRRAAACALPRRRGRRYGLFLVRRQGRWTAGICSVIAPRQLWLAVKRGRRGRAAAGSSCAS